jgi:hypothetical protein
MLHMLQVEFGAGVLEKQKSGRHSHQGHRGKRQINLSLHTCCEFQPVFALSYGQTY